MTATALTRQRAPSIRRAAAALMILLTVAIAAVWAGHAADRLPAPDQASASQLAQAPHSVASARFQLTSQVKAVQPGRNSTPPARAQSAAAGCGLIDLKCQITSAVTSWFASLVQSALQPLLNLINQTLLTTPHPETIPAVQTAWDTTLGVADSAFVLLLVIAGLILMGYQTVQTSYTVKDIAPRMVVAFIAANLSLLLIPQFIDLSNGLSGALAGPDLNATAAGTSLFHTLTNGEPATGLFTLLLGLVAAVMAAVVAVLYIIRLMAVIMLTVMSPLALAAYALPQTGWLARWWWRAWAAALIIPPVQALVLSLATKVFFSPGWTGFKSNPDLINILVAICVLYVMMRLPFWISRPVMGMGPSPIRSGLRFAFGAMVLSRAGGVLRGTSGRAAAATVSSGRPGSGGSRGGGGPRGGGSGGGGTRGTSRNGPATGGSAAGAPAGTGPAAGTGSGAGPAGGGGSHVSPPDLPGGGNYAGRHEQPAQLPYGDTRPGRVPALPAGRAARTPVPPLPGGPARRGRLQPLPGGPARRTRIPPLPAGQVPAGPVPDLPAGASRTPASRRLPADGVAGPARTGQRVPLPGPGERPAAPLPAPPQPRRNAPLPGGPARRTRVPPLPAGPPRRGAVPGLPAGSRGTSGSAPLPAAGLPVTGRHARPIPLPGGGSQQRPRHPRYPLAPPESSRPADARDRPAGPDFTRRRAWPRLWRRP